MGGFQSEFFVNEFAYRTKINYYRVKKFNSTKDQEKKCYDEKIKELIKKMDEKNYCTVNFYDVTLLINSLIGLLVFPEQEAYNYIKSNKEAFQKDMPTLYGYVFSDNPDLFMNTYRIGLTDEKFENNCLEMDNSNIAKYVIQHMRNAISHNRIMIHPINGEMSGRKNQQITDIVFEDACYYKRINPPSGNPKWKKESLEKDYKVKDDKVIIEGTEYPVGKFYMKVSVISKRDSDDKGSDLEKMLEEISNYLINIPIGCRN